MRGTSKPKFLDGAALETWIIQGGESDNPCPRCNGKVFEAEKMISMRHVYHKKCFTCRECSRPMDQFIACDAPDGEIVCRPCYGKKYGCTAYTLSGADMLKLLDTTTIKSEVGDQEACPRCAGKVFHAEKVVVKNRTYHRKCATCNTCQKPLCSRDLCDGKDSNIYCKSCYARKYGAPGYRGAGCGDWTDANSAETLRPCQDIDVSKIKGEEGDANTCTRCNGKIFDSERRASKKKNWHKKCFSCIKCHSILDASHYAFDAPDGEIYCQICFKRTFPTSEMPLIYSDTTLIKPSGGEGGCPRCDGAVFQAEEVNIKGRVYHKHCLTCKNCKRCIDINILAIGPDNDIYCRVCCLKISWPSKYVGATDTTIIPGEEGEPNNCPRCHGKVFEAEKMNSKKGFYHKKCFSCIKCKAQTDYFNAIEGPDDEIYCRVCYLRYHGPGGKNNYGDKTTIAAEADDAADACIRCKGRVFEAEKVPTKHGLFHKYCLSCNECHCNLDASTFFSAQDTEVYCRHCYAVLFGHKQKSNYTGWMDVKAIPGEDGDRSSCPRCHGKVFEAEKMVTRIGCYHKNCFSCIECARKLDSMTCCEGPDCEIYCKSCYSFEYGAMSRAKPKTRMSRARSASVPKMYRDQDDMLARSTIETWVIKAEKGDPNACPKCDGKVFEAEKMVTAAGKMYHKNCFRCTVCARQLDSLTNNDGPDGNLYCKMCYTKSFGPQTRSASDIEHKIIDTSIIKAEDPKKNCPRCGGAVFSAEEIHSGGKSYHKKCASCATCEKQLTFNTVFDGDDKNIYCKNCYHRKFAPIGYRGAGCSDWVDSESGNVLRHSYQAY